ncbi:MAG: 7-cyano-7-deazaguanine synthase QueC [Candidatus Eisenbacteria bacterium]
MSERSSDSSPRPPKRAIVLLSGGLDSATALACAREDGFVCLALTVRYGQRHSFEIECARRVARTLGAAEHRVLELDLSSFGGSSLFPGGEVPRSGGDPSARAEIPTTYVPARNTVFLSLALGWAEATGADAIYLGVNALDYSGYPDCRPEYLRAFQALADLATRRGVEGHPIVIVAPLLELTKSQIIARGTALGVDYSLTTSCYDPDVVGKPCGSCDACVLRRRGFEGAGLRDPLEGIG